MAWKIVKRAYNFAEKAGLLFLLSCLLLAAFLCLPARAAGVTQWLSRSEAEGWAEHTSAAWENNSYEAEQGLSVTVLDVGQGLAVFAMCEGHAMLYDGGGRETSSMVVNFLREQGVEKLDYAMVSHYDDDHVAGVIGALHVFDCDLILAPDYIGTTAIYESFVNLVGERGIPMEAPSVGNIYPLGSAQIEILGPIDFLAEEENNRCIAVRLSYENTAVILCGDAQAEEEHDIANGWMHLASSVYVANHHGSSSSGTDIFLDRVSPAYAVISCGQGNDFGHPSAATLDRLTVRGIQIYRTDVQGNISFVLDGANVRFEKEPTNDLSPGDRGTGLLSPADSEGDRGGDRGTCTLSPSGEDSRAGTLSASGKADARYICNFKSFIFHRPDCETVAKMSEINKVYSNDSREELISLGYRPCGICQP